jgi:SAM-dependent methyltransferase
MYEVHARIEDDHWWFRARRRIFTDAIRRHLPPRPAGETVRIVELGCGTGGNLPALARLGRVTGVEPDPGAAEVARRKGGAEVLVDRLPECPALPDSAFDVVALFDVIEHIEDDRGALRRAAGLLRPGGIAAISVPAFPWLWTRHDEALHHVRRYTRPALDAALREAGLTWRAGGYFNFWLFLPVAAVRLFHRALDGGPEHDLALPPLPLNAALEGILASESARAGARGYPWGVSLLAIAEAK